MPGAGASRERNGSALLRTIRDLLLVVMDLVEIYQCFCDRTRLRILIFLQDLRSAFVIFRTFLVNRRSRLSKHLAYLRSRGMVATKREQNWIIYSLPEQRADELERNLKCLQDCVQTDAVFKRDMEKLSRLAKSCCKPSSVFQAT